MKRALPMGLVAVLMGLAIPSLAAAQTCPRFDGAMTFPQINGPEDPEDYCWEVELFDGQELRQIDQTHAAVYYTDPEHLAFEITAELAHDAEGTAVPTSLAVVQPNVVVLTIHHRAGNPAAAGAAPFTYPISDGAGWGSGFISTETKGPPDESELKELEPKPSPPGEEALEPLCEVPALRGRSLKGARRALRHAHCRLGPVHGERSRSARVAKQYRRPGKTLPGGTEVGVKLA